MNNLFLKISINVALVFITVMALSIIPEQFPKLFGDEICHTGNLISSEYCEQGYRRINNAHSIGHWHWGYRHWLWFIMGLVLFVIQIIRIVVLINDNTKNK